MLKKRIKKSILITSFITLVLIIMPIILRLTGDFQDSILGTLLFIISLFHGAILTGFVAFTFENEINGFIAYFVFTTPLTWFIVYKITCKFWKE